jgi:hypothetical protein
LELQQQLTKWKAHEIKMEKESLIEMYELNFQVKLIKERMEMFQQIITTDEKKMLS